MEVDEDNSEEQRVNMRILDDQEEEVSICCEVKVLRDSGYGSMKPLRKEKCTDIKVMSSGRNILIITSKLTSAKSLKVEIIWRWTSGPARTRRRWATP